MLENIRENSQGLVAKIILGFIILTFAVAGIGSYTNSADTSVAEVNGVKISQIDFDKAYQNQRNRMAQQYGEMFETLSTDPNYMANFRNGILDNLINQELLLQASDALAIRISDDRIKETIREMPAFQVDGKFDNNRYLAVINQAGYYQSSDFRDYLRVEMTRNQLSQAVIASEFSLPYQEKLLQALQNQKRDLRFATVSAKQFEGKVEVNEQEVSDFYQANIDRYQNDEKVKVDFIAIDVNEIAKSIEVTEQDIENYYNDNIANFTQTEQRRVSHILIELGDDEAAAREQINGLKARIDAGEDFAELAKESSADVFSGENGGDLEWIEPGAMDEAFDEAAFALTNVGEVSDVVETEFGLHLIKLTELQQGQVKALADVAEELRATVSTEKAQDKFFELQQKAAELSFEVPDSLDEAASAVGVEVQTSDWIAKSANQAPFDNARVLEAVFSGLVLEEQLNSDVIEVSDQLALVVRLNEHQPANAKPLNEVAEAIKAQLVSEKAQAEAQVIADQLLTKLQAGEPVEELLTAHGAAFEVKTDVARYGSGLDNNLVSEAFKLPHPQEGKISAANVTLLSGDLAIVDVTAVKAGEAGEESPRFAQQLTQQVAQSVYQNYVAALRADATISRRNNVEASNQF